MEITLSFLVSIFTTFLFRSRFLFMFIIIQFLIFVLIHHLIYLFMFFLYHNYLKLLIIILILLIPLIEISFSIPLLQFLGFFIIYFVANWNFKVFFLISEYVFTESFILIDIYFNFKLKMKVWRLIGKFINRWFR